MIGLVREHDSFDLRCSLGLKTNNIFICNFYSIYISELQSHIHLKLFSNVI